MPKVIEGEASSTSQVVSARSATSTRTCGSPVRAVAFQSMRRTSSPGTYGRICASSVAVADRGGAVIAAEQAVDPARDRQVERRAAPSGHGPGPGRSGVRGASGQGEPVTPPRSGELEARLRHGAEHALDDGVGLTPSASAS